MSKQPLALAEVKKIPTPKSATKSVVNQKKIHELLRLVVEGEQDQAEAMIKKDKNLLLAAGRIIDLSGREFERITAFQYALWALDWHMWTMIQKYLPTERKPSSGPCWNQKVRRMANILAYNC
jgi:hypothetical protein